MYHAAGSGGAFCLQHHCLAHALQNLLAALTPLCILQPHIVRRQTPLLQSLAAGIRLRKQCSQFQHTNTVWQLVYSLPLSQVKLVDLLQLDNEACQD